MLFLYRSWFTQNLIFFFILLSHYRGKRGSAERPSIRLESTASEAPIYTVLTEMEPDTILINEVDKATERIVMTSSLSLVTDYTANRSVMELIQISHEVAAVTTGRDKIIEGHQVWRFYKKDTYQ